jgi:hypothetical protein
MGQPTLGRKDRDALVGLMAYRFFLVGEQRITRDRDRGVADGLTAVWFRDDLTLMHDLGWLHRWWLDHLGLPESRKVEFEIWLPPGPLRASIERALTDAREASAAGTTPPEGSPDDLFDRAAQVCEALIAEIDRMEEPT